MLLLFALPALAFAGSQNFTSSGTFTVPTYVSLTVTVNGSGGGGGGGGGGAYIFYGNGGDGSAGTSGGTVSFNGNVIGNGGGFGTGGGGGTQDGGGGSSAGSTGSNGSSGTASGGDTNTTGAGAGGGTGGGGGFTANPDCQQLPGGGTGGNGAAGGKAVKTYSVGQLTPGAGITVTVGNGGTPGGGGTSAGCAASGTAGNAGTKGSVSITWTDPAAPTVTTSAASGVTINSATLNGSIAATNGSDATQHGFAYGTVSTLTTVIATTTLGSKSGTGSFSGAVSSLSTGTTYYVRAYATNSNGTGYGSIQNFTTASPTLTINKAVTINGDLNITGALSKSSGSFVIDHPLDPKNKLLYHSFVESPEVMNVYVGRATLDDAGKATISLPTYFLPLNKDFRYFATPIEVAMPDLHLSVKVKPRFLGLLGTPVFTIAGGSPGGEVSWMVTGVRHDPYILANPIIPEVQKGAGAPYAQGMYIHPELYATSTKQK